MVEDLRQLNVSEEDFTKDVRLHNLADNGCDNRRRALTLGFTGNDVQVAPGAIIRIPKEQVGNKVFFGLYVYCHGNVTIEDEVLIGPHCSITAGNHKYNPQTQSFSLRTEKDYDNSIVIGRGSWLASKVTVTAGVKIGKANLICAGAVVTHSTEDFAIMAGVPAKQIGRIEPQTGEYIWFHKNE